MGKLWLPYTMTGGGSHGDDLGMVGRAWHWALPQIEMVNSTRSPVSQVSRVRFEAPASGRTHSRAVQSPCLRPSPWSAAGLWRTIDRDWARASGGGSAAARHDGSMQECIPGVPRIWKPKGNIVKIPNKIALILAPGSAGELFRPFKKKKGAMFFFIGSSDTTWKS